MEYKRGSHSVYDLKYQIVFCTKYGNVVRTRLQGCHFLWKTGINPGIERRLGISRGESKKLNKMIFVW